MNITFEDMFAQMGGNGQAREPNISHVGQLARMAEFRERLDGGCTFAVGDVVTPRAESMLKNVGAPHVVIAVRSDAQPDFNVDKPGSTEYGAVYDFRVLHMIGERIIMHWSESVYYEAYDPAVHERSDAERLNAERA